MRLGMKLRQMQQGTSLASLRDDLFDISPLN